MNKQDIYAGIRCVIFDMDGLLVDSEPLWKIAEREVFATLGHQLTDDLMRQVMGFRLSEVVQHWYHVKPWPDPDFTKTEAAVLERVKGLILERAGAMEGVKEILAAIQKRQLPIALASSSAMSLIEAVLEKLEIRSYFSLLWSAEYEPYGKPHPGIFLSTAQKMGVDPKHCLVFEDSVNGVIAAKAARMKCVAVPEPVTFDDPRFVIADWKEKSLLHLLP